MRVLTAFVVFLFGQLLIAQQLIEYDKDFEFNEGVYLNFKQFRENKPIEKSKLVSEFNKTDFDFLKQVVEVSKIKYIDTSGKEQTVKTADIWGYSNNNSLLINYKNDFNKIPFIGSYCHFTAMVVYYTRMRDPFMGGGIGTISVPAKELDQFILDTDSGIIYPFSVETITFLLEKDRILLDEFTKLKKKQKRDSIFLYLRKYNERHPLLFPAKQ